MMKKALAVLLCLCIAFLPALSHAGARTTVPGFHKSFEPPIPKPNPPKGAATADPALDLTVAPKKQIPPFSKGGQGGFYKPKAASSLNASSAPPSSDTLPVAVEDNSGNIILGYGIKSITVDSNQDKMVVTQSAQQAIQNWASFNIGADATVQFNQKNSSYICLNRIFDQDPSQIFGKLTAVGQIYLINQNGILFAPGSQLNVHTMIASSLNILDTDFMNGVLDFKAQDYQETGNTNYLTASVINRGTITTDNLGSAFLLGPTVENDGTINATTGQIGLAAGTTVSLYSISGSTRSALAVDVTSHPGDATDAANAQLTAASGLVGMYGENVYQDGTVTAETGREKNGEIELVAANEVYFGPASVTSSPVSTSNVTADQSFPFLGGVINIYGLDPSNPLNVAQGVNQIVNCGSISAPSGIINMTAQSRVYLETGSSIGVSGNWITEPVAENTTKVELNSVELADYPQQKNGILHGATVTVNNLLGSSIGDISGSLTTQQLTAQQASLQGGSINIASLGDVIVKQGASLDFSGGGINYTAGYVTTTGLVSGGKVYAINNAPETIAYSGIVNVSNYVNGYVEGSNAGSLLLTARNVVLDGNIQGAATPGVYQTRTAELADKMGDQNTFGLVAPLGGALIIGALPSSAGLIENDDFLLNAVVLQSVVAPLPSTFGPDTQPYAGPVTTYLSTQKLSAAGLSNLQIAANTTLTVTADADISMIPGSTLSLYARAIDFQGTINVPSGKVNLVAIDNVTAFPSLDNSTAIDNPLYVPLVSQIYLEEGSQIDVAGQRIDNSIAATGIGGVVPFTYIAGGSVSILNESYYGQGVIAAGLIDVSGGYGIGQKGVVAGGNAGTLSIQGAGIVLYGDLEAYSLQGNNGGAITMSANNVEIAPSAPASQNLNGTLVLGQNQLDDTGFTQISLQSVNDIVFESGVSLSPSLVKFSPPIPGVDSGGNALTNVAPYLIGKSSISLKAGILFTTPQTLMPQFIAPNYEANLNASIQVFEGGEVSVAPVGSIGMQAPFITIDGDLNAPAGTVTIKAGTSSGGNLTLQSDSVISAEGYNEPMLEPVMLGYPVSYTALPGGSVTLSAPEGAVTTQANSVIDVSGSRPVITYILNGNGVPIAQTIASNPGSVTISANTLFSNGTSLLQGTLEGKAQLPGMQGGTLSITGLSNQADYILADSDVRSYLAGGFDALTFASSFEPLVFSGDINIAVGRSLTFDAPGFIGSGDINFQAPWIQLQNTSVPGLTPATPSGAYQLTLSASWIDLAGAFSLSGFKSVTLSAVHDLTLTEWEYGTASWAGQMQTSANLILQADRIYPTTYSDFTINSSGTVTIQPSGSPHNSSPVYSAGGDLTIQAQAIDMEGGELAAPLGQITLYAPTGRVYLGEGSTISTAGSVAVDYGSLLDGVFWTTEDKTSSTDLYGIPVSGTPPGSVSIVGSEVIMKSGSTIDIAGGGSIFAYQFQPGVQGSVDPFQLQNQYVSQGQSGTQNLIYDSALDAYRLLTSADPVQNMGRYVIVPGSDYSVPASAAAQDGLQVGQAVYLEGSKGLAAGMYALLPEQYAFLPGAMVVTATGANVLPGTQLVSGGGFPVVAGYFTYAGTSIQPAFREAFEVQPASYVLKQGTFYTSTFVAGNAGSVSINGNTTILDGVLLASALQGYQGGSISLSGANAYIDASTVQLLPQDFNFGTPVSDVQGLPGTLQVSADAISGKGFQVIDIGYIPTPGNPNTNNLPVTGTITMETGAVLNAASVVFSAQNAITLQSGAQIIAVDSTGTGSASLVTPNGLLAMDANSLIHASDQVNMTIGQIYFDPKATLTIDHGALNLTGPNFYFLTAGSPQTGTSGLDLTSAFWGNFAGISDVTLSASGNSSDGSTQGLVEFLGSMSLSAKDSFTINAAAIEWPNAPDNGSVSITAPLISLQNRGVGTPMLPSLTNSGLLTLNAANEISVGEGPLLGGSAYANSSINAVLIDGFSTVNFNAQKEIAFIGSGSLVTGASALNFASGSVTTSYYEDTNTPYTAANFTVSAAKAAVNISPPSGGSAALLTSVSPGGTLEIDANNVGVSGLIQMASATLKLDGNTGVTLGPNSTLLDGGSIQELKVNGYITGVGNPGGSIYLNAGSGAVNIETGAVVNVSGVVEDNTGHKYNVFADSNDLGVNAGLISIYSPNAPVTLEGTLTGAAGYWKSWDGSSITYGIGGSFVLDTENLTQISSGGKTGLSGLLYMFASGGFNDSLDVRSRTDSSLTVAEIETVVARQFTLTADQGSIDVKGNIVTSDPNGDSFIELYAGKDLTLESAISATGSQSSAHGGEIVLSTTGGVINFENGATLDVSGGTSGGNVYFRAPLDISGNDVNSITSMTLDGAITGARQIVAEGFQAYIVTGGDITSAESVWGTGIQNFMNGYGSVIQSGLFSHLTLQGSGVPTFLPGLEIDSSGNLTLNSNSAWDLSSISPLGMLTIRAAGDMVINQSIVDAPGITVNNSWGITLVAGADLNSANPTEFVPGTGNLTISNKIVVFSDSAPLRLAAGNGLTIDSAATPGYMINISMPYSVGTYSGSINVNTGGDLQINGGAIESASGDIYVHVGGDLDLNFVQNSLGSIRTTGESSNGNSADYLHYGNGGNITVNVEGNVNGQVALYTPNFSLDGWDSYNLHNGVPQGWSASYNNGAVTQGLATMAGGNLTVYAGGDFTCQAGTFSPYAYQWNGTTLISSVPMNDKGNLTIFSGGNMQGRFLVADGTGELHSMGNFGLAGVTTIHAPIELFNATLDVTAQGDINIGAIINPTIARPFNSNSPVYWDLEYAPTTSVTLASLTGNVWLYGDDSFYGSFLNGNPGLNILPPTMAVYAAGNIDIFSNFTLAPSASGNLILIAGGDIEGQMVNGNRTQISMSDMSDALSGQLYNEVYGPQLSSPSLNVYYFSASDDPAGLLHANDDTPIVVSAGGDISSLILFLPKEADISAGGNIRDIYYFGQNNSSKDVTMIEAGGSILFSSEPNAYLSGGRIETGIQVSGPGALAVEAGLSMDLGTTAGIQAMGNTFDPSQLPETGATLIVASGYSKDFSNAAADAPFFATLQSDGTEYSKDMAAGNTAAANQVVAGARADVIAPFFNGSATKGSGDIDMTASQISTLTPGGGIFVFVNGSLNVGLTTFSTGGSQVQGAGIFTAQGGPINIYANGDVNVNESRVMTFEGGDITVWSDEGSINAGLGSKTEVDATPPTLTEVNGVPVLAFNPPPVGSGIRAVTYAPDGVDGPAPAPPAGDIYLFAPTGVINAGEAGVAGRNVILGALQVLNAQNISFTQAAIGIPVTGNLAGLTALSGQGSIAQAMQNQEAAVVSAASASAAPLDMTSFNLDTASLDVKVLSFFDVDQGQSDWETTDN